MIKVIIYDWQEGLMKVSLTKLQREIAGLSLKESKNNVDSLLERNNIILIFSNLEVANKFVKEASMIGAVCEMSIDDL